jgi:hypothetical protein
MSIGIGKKGCEDCFDPATVIKIGDGKCSECAGTGYNNMATCSKCNGSGKYTTCDGTGEVDA